jgi:biotin carboxyl carrier protein
MSTHKTLTLAVARDGERVKLLCPGVGTFSLARGEGQTFTAGDVAGVLTTLGASFELLIPDGISGVVVSARPERVLAPVDYGAELYELAPLATGAASAAPASSSGAANAALVFRSPSAGRFWQRSAPGEAALASAGDVVEAGRALGLIEVMKTFTLVSYSTRGGLPAKARIARVLVEDGAEVSDRTPLFELESA